jgi:hypothetical protein
MEAGTRRGIVVAMLLAVGADAASLPVTQSLGARPAQGIRSFLPVCWLRVPCATPCVHMARGILRKGSSSHALVRDKHESARRRARLSSAFWHTLDASVCRTSRRRNATSQAVSVLCWQLGNNVYCGGMQC